MPESRERFGEDGHPGNVRELRNVIERAVILAALAGYSVFANLSVEVQAATTAVAAGAILSMLAETMIPEAFEGTHDWAGLITCGGFVCAFALSMLGG